MAHRLVRLYPPEWRARYGEEFEALLVHGPGGWRAVANVLVSALRERVAAPATLGVVINRYPGSVVSLSTKPGALVPIAMSLTALMVVLGNIAAHGVVHEADEGAVAHIWQLLMAGQLPILLAFVIRWFPRVPRQTLVWFALQIGAALAAMAPVYFLKL